MSPCAPQSPSSRSGTPPGAATSPSSPAGPDRKGGEAGFTLIEAFVVLAMLALVISLGYPAIQKLILRSRLEGTSQAASMLIQRARLESIKSNVLTIVEIDPATDTLRAYADLDGPAVGDPPDLVYNPIAGEAHRTTDYLIGQVESRRNVVFDAPAGQQVIDGLSAGPSGQLLAFLPNGTAQAEGAFRIADAGGLNFLEIRIAPAATGRVQLRKWDDQAMEWRANREEGEAWKWNM